MHFFHISIIFPSFQASLWARKAVKLPALISSGTQDLEFYPVSLFTDVINLKKYYYERELEKTNLTFIWIPWKTAYPFYWLIARAVILTVEGVMSCVMCLNTACSGCFSPCLSLQVTVPPVLSVCCGVTGRFWFSKTRVMAQSVPCQALSDLPNCSCHAALDPLQAFRIMKSCVGGCSVGGWLLQLRALLGFQRHIVSHRWRWLLQWLPVSSCSWELVLPRCLPCPWRSQAGFKEPRVTHPPGVVRGCPTPAGWSVQLQLSTKLLWVLSQNSSIQSEEERI